MLLPPVAAAIPGLDTLLDLIAGPRGTGAANPCLDGQTVCDAVYSWSGQDARLARAADVLVGVPLALLGLLLLGLVIRWLLHRIVDRIVTRTAQGGSGSAVAGRNTRRIQRSKTMGSLLKSIITGIVVAVVATMMLSQIGVNIAPIIASAGIIGVAVGFGAQSLVKDFLSGIFMIVEDQYGVGDVVDVGEAVGTVEAVGLRVTRLRDIDGTVWYVPNGSISRVGNQSMNWAQTVLDISVAYDEDLARVRRILEEVAHDVWEDEDFKGRVIEEPSVWGVQDLAADGVLVRVVLKTAPLEQWGVARTMRERIKARFDHEGIEIPFQQRVVWHRTEEGEPSSATGGGRGGGDRGDGDRPVASSPDGAAAGGTS